jgi:hypothetical protein
MYAPNRELRDVPAVRHDRAGAHDDGKLSTWRHIRSAARSTVGNKHAGRYAALFAW